MTNESEGNVKLSEFDKTVDYGENSTDDSLTGSSPHDSQEAKAPSIVNYKPDWSLRPPLIMRSQSCNKKPS